MKSPQPLRLLDRARPERSELRVGRVTFPLIRVAGGRLRTWWMDGTIRRQASASTIESLRRRLQEVSNKILSGRLEELEGSDHRSYLAARQALQPLGIQVDVACREYAAALEKCKGASLGQLADFYTRYAIASGALITHGKTFTDTVKDFLAAKQLKGLSDAYLAQMEDDLTRAAGHFANRELSDISPADLDLYIAGLGRNLRIDPRKKKKDPKNLRFVKSSPRRRQQVRDSLVTLFRWARAKRLLPNLPTSAEGIEEIKVVTGGNPIYSPAQLLAYLKATRRRAPEWLPWLAIGAFTGMRTAAILRLDWQAFDWTESTIEVDKKQSKISRRYLAPIPEVLAAWLTDLRNSGARGNVAPGGKDQLSTFTASLSRWTVMPWRKNALRSSFIGYRFAQTGDAAAVARDCNTSAKEVLGEYKNVHTVTGEPVTKKLAQEWFALFPPHDGEDPQIEFSF